MDFNWVIFLVTDTLSVHYLLSGGPAVCLLATVEGQVYAQVKELFTLLES